MDIKSFDGYVDNTHFNVLTDDGYKPFDGITKTKLVDPAIELTLNNGDKLICTFNHKLYVTKEKYERAKFLNVGDTLYSPYNKVVITDIKESKEEYVYDLINVHDTNSYLATPYMVKSSNCLYLDEFAFVENDVEFYTGTYPTVTSGKNTKVIITSTPRGLNMFYKIFNDSQNGNNKYKSYKIGWEEHPERDEEWYNETRSNIGESKFAVEYECKFMGSAGTLINGRTLEKLTFVTPIRETDHKHKTIKVYAEPVEYRKYVTIVDTSEGVQLDYSVITVIDVSVMPYKQVFLYKDNTTPPLTFASIAAEVAERYNHSVMLVENNNSSGGIVSNTLWNDIEYDNMLTTKIAINTRDTEIGFGSKSIPGVRTTKKTKAVGCTYLKNLVESDQLQVMDYDTVSELSTFVRVGNSYEAEKNKHDDIVMTLVMFAWFTSQDYFEDETGISSLSTMNETLMEDNDMDFVLGFISNGTEEVDEARALFDKGLFN